MCEATTVNADKSKVIPLIEPWIGPEVAVKVAAQVESGFLGPGQRTTEFAEALAACAGAKRVVLTTSGTVALSVAAIALGLKPGDEIIVPAYGVISTINGFATVGLKCRLVDIVAGTGCIDPERLEAAITDRTRAVCFVNFAGNTGPALSAVAKICSRRGIPLIEDAACALGHWYEGRAAGTFGTVGVYSFSAAKVLTTGQGGALVFNDQTLADAAAAYVDHGDLEWRRRNLNRAIGTNLRFTDVLSTLGLAQLQTLGERLERKRRAYAVMREELGPFLYSVPGAAAPLHNIVFSREPARLVSQLKAQGISALLQYRTISQHPAYQGLATERYPNADWWTENAVYLPFGLALTEDDASRIASAVRATDVALELPPR